jgi:hypothetical protein
MISTCSKQKIIHLEGRKGERKVGGKEGDSKNKDKVKLFLCLAN